MTEEGLPTEGQQTPDAPTDDQLPDPVGQADIESFPASDPPAWGGDDPQPEEPPHRP